MSHLGQRNLLVFLCPVMLAGVFALPANADSTTQATLSGAVRRTQTGVAINTHACVLTLRPITASAVRVRCSKEAVKRFAPKAALLSALLWMGMLRRFAPYVKCPMKIEHGSRANCDTRNT